tara:strand:+ start:118 stop:450 length:333 start_codon:yes stop_codon:yes gene_type:complete
MKKNDIIALDKTEKTASQFVVAAWFLGLAYFYWFDKSVPTLDLVTNILFVIVGMFASSIIFGMGFHFIGRLIAKVLTGRWESLPGLSLIMGIVSSVVTFFSVKYIIMYLV